MNDDELEKMAQAADEAPAFRRRRRTMEDFRYDEQQEKYWDTTTGTLLGPKSVDGAIARGDWPTRPDGRTGELIPYAPSKGINNVDTGLTVEGSTWWPGKPVFIENYVINDRGAIPKKGAICYNQYNPPDLSNLRTDKSPDRWIEHVKYLWPDPIEHEHFFDFCAHMIQRPDEKVNHGVVIAGAQGIGKDTAMLPLRRGIGNWNAAEIDPDKVSSQYNHYVKSVMLVINEVRPHDEEHKASNFYNQLKPLLAAPPDMIPMEMKYANPIYVRNLCHVFLTTNDPLTMYIPPEDRRLFVMTSPLPDPKRNDVFSEGYFNDIHDYLDDGGADAVVNWLLQREIMVENFGAAPPMTAGKKAVISSAKQVRRSALDDFLEKYFDDFFQSKKPDVVFAADLTRALDEMEYFDDRQNIQKLLRGKTLHFKMAEHGYDMMQNAYASEWRNGKFRSRMAFCSREVPRDEQYRVVEDELTKRPLDFRR